jgi:hypothetical protein
MAALVCLPFLDDLFANWRGWMVLGWLGLWVGGQLDLFGVLVLKPARRERADLLLRAGVAYLLRGDATRAAGALGRSASLDQVPAVQLYLAEAERQLGRNRRARRRLADLAQGSRGDAWRWEIARARLHA